MSHLNLSEPLDLSEKYLARFFGRIEPQPDGCVLWTGAKLASGYGHISIRGNSIRCHRLAWAIENGPISAGVCVLHTCDVHACVNLDHLYLGSHQDNMSDMARKERGTKSKNGMPYGAHPQLRGGGFRAQVKAGGVKHHLGTYPTAEEASAYAQEFRAAHLLAPG